MDNNQLVKNISDGLEITEKAAETLLKNFSEIILKHTSELDTLNIPPLGSFEGRFRNERMALHPASGKKLLVPPKVNIVFKPSAVLKLKVKNGK